MASLPSRLRFKILERDGFTCQYCGRQAPEIVLEVDHKQPRCDDGEDVEENLHATCRDCNQGKGGRSAFPKTQNPWEKITGILEYKFDAPITDNDLTIIWDASYKYKLRWISEQAESASSKSDFFDRIRT